MFKKWYFFSLFIISLTNSFGQTSFTAKISSTQVKANSTFIIEYTITNSEVENIQLPTLQEFTLVGGPSTSTSMTIINGKSSSYVKYSYEYLANKTGKFTIPPAKVAIKGRLLTSNSLQIEVVKGSSNEIISDDMTFFKMEISNQTAYVGQQLVLNHVLYTRRDISGLDMLKAPKMEAFFSTPHTDHPNDGRKTTIGGKQYYAQTVRRMLLFPQKAGNQKLDAALWSYRIPLDDGEPPNIFFFNTRRMKSEQASSNDLNLLIKTLPEENRPNSFSGGVGDFTMLAAIDKKTATTDEAFSITMTITGDGDPKMWSAPKLNLEDGLEYYEPSLIKEENFIKNEKLHTKRVYEYILLAKKVNEYSLKPEFSFFSIKDNDYKIIANESFSVNILKGNMNETTILTTSNEDEKENFSTNYMDNISFVKLGSIMLLSLSFIGGLFFFYRQKRQKEFIDPILEKRKIAKKVALKNLEKAIQFKDKNQNRLFFNEISRALNQYLKDKLGVKNEELDRNSIEKLLVSRKLPQNLVDDFNYIHKQCELSLFAAMNIEMSDIYEKTENLIIECDLYF